MQLPSNFKVDGRLSEWPAGLQAYNNATRVQYVLADDTDNLYLAVKSKDVNTTAKILTGGITLYINTSEKKTTTGPSITVPQTNAGWVVGPSGSKTNFILAKDSLTTVEAIRQIKFIKISNFQDLKDTVLSIYNEHGIQTKFLYIDKSLVCEMIIPKKYLGLVGASNGFRYQIKLEGFKQDESSGIPPMRYNPDRLPSNPMNIFAEMSTPTDFWGDYTLAK